MVFGESTPQNRSASIQWWSKSFYGQSDCSENHLICNSSSKLVDQGLKVQFRGPCLSSLGWVCHRRDNRFYDHRWSQYCMSRASSNAVRLVLAMDVFACQSMATHRTVETGTTSTTTTTAANRYKCLHSIILLVFYALIGAQIATVPGIVSSWLQVERSFSNRSSKHRSVEGLELSTNSGPQLFC